jgi:steroid 5-alpha reductase family enzyme
VIGQIFGLNAVVIVAIAVAIWRFAVRSGDPSFIDFCWGLGFVVIAWLSFLTASEHTGRGLLLALLATAWGLRLGVYLLRRWRRHGPDARYQAMLKRQSDPARFMLTHVFALQAVLMLIVSLPLQFGQAYAGRDGSVALHAIGVALVALGLFFEWTGDYQLSRFKADPSNKGHVMDRGLWRYSRHPNYFGDFSVWWGLFLLSTSSPVTYVAIIGPLVMSVLLMRVSGVGPLEKQLHATKPKYRDYVARTSAFFPRPPRG